MKDKLFNQLKFLENERARLEPLAENHFEELWKVANDQSIWEFTQAKICGKGEFKNYFFAALSEKDQQISMPFAVFDKQSRRWAGSTRYGSIAFEHRRLEIGWSWYARDLHGSGLNAACKFLLLEYAFQELELNRVELKTSLLNIRSQKAMEKLGAVKEGIFRRHIINSDGSLRDTVYYSYIRDEWNEIKKCYFNSCSQFPR